MLWTPSLIVLQLITLTGPGGQKIEVNLNEIVSVREPRHSDHFAAGTHCAINTTDQKVVAVQDRCDVVLRAIEDWKRNPQ